MGSGQMFISVFDLLYEIGNLFFLNSLLLFSRSDNDPKDLYKKGDMWIFVRKKHFDDLEGYVLLLDKDLKVSYIEYSAISDENIAIIKLNNATF